MLKELSETTIVPNLSTRALYEAHNERDFENPLWKESDFKILIVRLSPFIDVERSTPHSLLYKEIRSSFKNAYIDFSFFPREKDRKLFIENNIPLLHGIASKNAVKDFDLVLISNAYTLELLNLPYLLKYSSTPFTKKDRCTNSSDFPIFVLGGSNAFASQALSNKSDSFVDAIFFGEAEGRIGKLIEALILAKSNIQKASKETRNYFELYTNELLKAAETNEGLWITATSHKVKQAKALIDHTPFIKAPIFAGEEALTERIEITRGCPSFCTFCFEGWERKPYRERSYENIIAEAKHIKQTSHADTIEISSYNFNAHTDIVRIIKDLHTMFQTVNFMSQRVDILNDVPYLIPFEVSASKRSFTLGIEGISERTRRYYNKELKRSSALSVIEKLMREQVRELKLFYILSGIEDSFDLNEFNAFIIDLKALSQETRSKARIIFSFGLLIRMPFTPLAFSALTLQKSIFTPIQKRIKEILTTNGFEYRENEHFDEYSLSQILTLLPDGLFELLLEMVKKDYIYDTNLSKGAFTFAEDFLKKHNYLQEDFYKEKEESYQFAYDFVETNTKKAYQYERYLLAKEFTEKKSCFAGACAACEACSQTSEKTFLTQHTIKSASLGDCEAVAKIVSQKSKAFKTYYLGSIEKEDAFADKNYIQYKELARLSKLDSSLTLNAFCVQEVLLKTKEGSKTFPNSYGKTLFCLNTKNPVNIEVLKKCAIVPLKTINNIDVPELKKITLSILFHTDNAQTCVNMLQEFLTKENLSYTAKKIDLYYNFILSEKALKKKNIASISLKTNEDKQEASLVGLSKCDLGELSAIAKTKNIHFEIKINSIE